MAGRRRARAAVLAAWLLVGALAACGVLPYTGPPEGDFYERADHGHP